MTRAEFIGLTYNMEEKYGVMSFHDNYPNTNDRDVPDDDLFFQCPECNEPIFFCDYGDKLDVSDVFHCPICEMDLDCGCDNND